MYNYAGVVCSRGVLQPDMWGAATSGRWDWAGLRAAVAGGAGLRNSLLVAPMPTASTAQVVSLRACVRARARARVAGGRGADHMGNNICIHDQQTAFLLVIVRDLSTMTIHAID